MGAQDIVLVLALTVVLMAGHSVGRRFGRAGVDVGGRMALRRLQAAVDRGKVAFTPSDLHSCGSTAIAIDRDTNTLAIASGRRWSLVVQGALIGCRTDRRSLFGWTWHYLCLSTRDGEMFVTFKDASACLRWQGMVNAVLRSAG